VQAAAGWLSSRIGAAGTVHPASAPGMGGMMGAAPPGADGLADTGGEQAHGDHSAPHTTEGRPPCQARNGTAEKKNLLPELSGRRSAMERSGQPAAVGSAGQEAGGGFVYCGPVDWSGGPGLLVLLLELLVNVLM